MRDLLAGADVSWGPYQTFGELVSEDSRCSVENPLFETVEHPGVGPYLMPGSPLWFDGLERLPVAPAPRLGEHTEPVLAELLGLSPTEIGRLYDARVVA